MITKHFPVLFFMNFHNSVPRVVLFFAFERTERVLERECSREREREREGERERVMNASVVSLPKWLFPQEKEPTDEEVYKRLVCTFLRKSCKLSCSRLCSRLYVLRRKDVEKTILIDNFFPPTGRKKEREREEREREREREE